MIQDSDSQASLVVIILDFLEVEMAASEEAGASVEAALVAAASVVADSMDDSSLIPPL